MKKIGTCFLVNVAPGPKFSEGFPIRNRPSSNRFQCANLLLRVENVAGHAQNQYNTIKESYLL